LKNILLIEDTPDMLKVIQSNLSVRGYQVITASKGEEGLILARTQRPDLIILDIRLPDITGWSILQTLKSDPKLKEIPVFVMTASELAGDEKKALNLGAAYYLSKPFSLHDFISRIDKVLKEEQ
jgi:DNA-binding response OmpR family regulator